MCIRDRGRGANGGDIVSLDVVNDVANSVQSFLDGIVDFMMHGSEMCIRDSTYTDWQRRSFTLFYKNVEQEGIELCH